MQHPFCAYPAVSIQCKTHIAQDSPVIANTSHQTFRRATLLIIGRTTEVRETERRKKERRKSALSSAPHCLSVARHFGASTLHYSPPHSPQRSVRAETLSHLQNVPPIFPFDRLRVEWVYLSPTDFGRLRHFYMHQGTLFCSQFFKDIHFNECLIDRCCTLL